MNRVLNKLLPTIVAALIFMIFALYNGYPIMSGDTATYLDSAFVLHVPEARPVFYGLFIRVTSFCATLWTTVFVQCILLAYLVIRLIKHFLPNITTLRQTALVLLISLGTISCWYAGQIMPDIFTPMLFLATFLYLFGSNSKAQAAILLVLIYISIVVHFSHYAIATVFVLALLLISFFSEKIKAVRRRLVFFSAIVLASWLSLFTSNYIGGYGFVSSNARHVFLMGKLCESGVLSTYLEKACPEYHYGICDHKDALPNVAWDFVWDQQNSPVFKQGGWAATKEEYNTIIKDIVSRPKYWPFLAYKSMEATFRQIILLNIDEGEERHWIVFDKEHPLYITMDKYLPHEINEFRFTRQNNKTFNLFFYDDVYAIVLLLSSFLVLMTLKRERLKQWGWIYGVLILFLFCNAFITATFGNVLTRLNSRTIWLLPMLNILVLYQYISPLIAKLKSRWL